MRIFSFLRFLCPLLSLTFIITVMIAFSDPLFAFITLFCAIIHEAGHVVAIYFICGKTALPRAVRTGFRIKVPRHLSYTEEIIICLAGPLVNLLMFLICSKLFPTFSFINLATAISNLIPLREYDGYKVIKNITAQLFGAERAEKTGSALSFFTSAVFVFISLFTILKFNGGYWIFFIFFIILAREIYFFQNQTKDENK